MLKLWIYKTTKKLRKTTNLPFAIRIREESYEVIILQDRQFAENECGTLIYKNTHLCSAPYKTHTPCTHLMYTAIYTQNLFLIKLFLTKILFP